MIQAPGPDVPIYTPAQLNQEVKQHIEAGFGRVWVQGEISNLAQPASGHQYFSLKDGKAQIRCALFKPHAQKLSAQPGNGDEVLVRGQLSLYAPRGDYQLIADAVLGAGVGALHAEFERLKKQLSAEGLFDPAHKKPLPQWPRRIAVVTSASGAAIEDIRNTWARRWPVATLEVYPATVQGDQAPASIGAALQRADQDPQTDVIILARGGGSIEDLWAFNDEALARIVFALDRPMVTGVGHETDTTIVDFVADHRAATPTQAALVATPDAVEINRTLDQHLTRLAEGLQRLFNHKAQGLDLLGQRLSRVHPAKQLEDSQRRLNEHHRRLSLTLPMALERHQQGLQGLGRMLHQLSPLNVLERGYGIVQDSQGQAIDSNNPPIKGMDISILLSSFEVESKVESVRPRAPDSTPND